MNKTNNLTCFFLVINLEKTEGVFITNILTCILNSVFSLITCVGNFAVLHAIRKSRDLHSPSFILLSCLAASDLLVGAICQPVFVAQKIAEIVKNFGTYCMLYMMHFFSGWVTTGVSCLTIAAVSIDRLLALILHLRYDAVVTAPRVFQTTLCLWIFPTTVVTLRIWMTYTEWILIPLGSSFLTFLLTTLTTSKIFYVVRKHQRQIHDQTAVFLQTNTVNVLKCRKLAVTVLYVYGLYLFFYLPYCVMMLVETFLGYTCGVKIAYDYAITAVSINSCLNPLVYCWRIREIRRAVKNALRKQ